MTAPGPSVLSALATTGVQLSIGPFLVRVRSDVPGVGEHLGLLYSDFPMSPVEHGHFDVAIVRGAGIRSWIRAKATMSLNGLTPFLPVPARMAGPAFEWGLNWCVGRNAHRLAAVHAAVVERNGRVMILPAPPGSGKSTLCAALVCAGWRLFSDEFALIDPESGRVFPAPRPVSLKEGSIEIIRRRNPAAVFSRETVDVEDKRFVHMRPPTDAVLRSNEHAMPGWLILPKYSAGQPTALDPLSKADALMQLTDQSFNYNYLGAKGYTSLVDVVRRCQCYRLEYSDLDDVLDVLDRMTAN